VTICSECERWAANSIPGAAADPGAEDVAALSGAPPPTATVPPSWSRGADRGKLVVLVSAVAGVGLITLALLSARGPTEAAGTDAPAGKPSAPSMPAHESVATQSWNAGNRAHWVGDQRNAAAFELLAENTVAIWMNQARPLLVVRCASKSTEVFVSTGSSIKMESDTEDHTVTFAFDQGRDVTERWPDSVEHDALFAPDGSTFARRLIAARTLRFGYTPHNAAPVVASFHVSGLAELLEPLAKDCGTGGK
jgi:hypothetical protein